MQKNLHNSNILLTFVLRKTERYMVIENGIKVYSDILKKCVEYVNNGWHMSYRIEDVVGIEISATFIFVHFNKEDYTKDAYPISIEIIFK